VDITIFWGWRVIYYGDRSMDTVGIHKRYTRDTDVDRGGMKCGYVKEPS